VKLKQAVKWPLKYADALTRLGTPCISGILLHGPTGCSKTTLAKVAAHAAQMIHVAANDLAFSSHVVLLTAFTLFQITIYDCGTQNVSRVTMVVVAAAWIAIAIAVIITIATNNLLWLIYCFNLTLQELFGIAYWNSARTTQIFAHLDVIENYAKRERARAQNTMADVNVNAPAEQAPTMAPPTRTDDQILPRSKSFTNSLTIPSIYIQQFWDTVRYVKNTGSYSCQLDEQWFELNKDTLRDALQITQVDNNKPFSSPPTPDALINFVNDLGYPKVVRTLSAVVTNDMHQPWRALTTIINLCLTGKTLGFERPRSPVLQILLGVVNRAHIDYTERMWEEFTQSIHSFVKYKKNLALHTQGKKKVNPIIIPSVRFTKLIIDNLQSKHKFHPRLNSPLHFPYEEYVLVYLKFSTKGTKREVFGMPISNDLLTVDIRGEQYYNEYLEKVAKHQRYLAGEEGSDPDSPTPKPDKATKPKATKKSKPSTPKATSVTEHAAAKASKSTSSQQPKPKPAPAKPQEKKRKMVKETSDEPSLAKSSKRGLVTKRRKPTSSLRLVDEFTDEGILENEPRFDDEEADMQRAVEESLKDGKGKKKVIEEQVAHTLLDLNTPKKKSTTDQDIFKRRTPETDEPTGPSIHHEDEKATLPDGGPDPSNSAESRPLPSQGIHTGSSLDLMDKGFIATAYPNVQENLKLTVKEQVILKEPASSTGTLSSLQHLAKDFSFGDQFFNDKPSGKIQSSGSLNSTFEQETDTMADVNVNAPAEQAPTMAPPTRTDDQILPRSKSFTNSLTIPSIYIQQFWDTVRYVKNTGSYSCQLDEQWFDLNKDTLRDALQITQVDNNKPFSSPPTPDALINFVNDLGYPKVVRTLSAVVTNDMHQPWRALTTIINLCLTGKTLGFERPRSPVLQILLGVVNRAHIDYTERMWEEFTQSIHSFVKYKKNLALHTQGKKKVNPIIIPSVRFTKLIIDNLQSKHKFHPRPDSPLHLPYEEYVLGYLKFSAKGTKREVFGMPISNDLITADIRGGQYYNAYLEKVAKHLRYLAGEEGSDPDSPTPKPDKATKPKATKKSKPSTPKATSVTEHAAAKASKSTSSQQPKPKPAPAKPQEKKRKMFTDEGILENEPRFDDEEADMQRAVEESLKDGKGKKKVIEEQVAHTLLDHNTPKKKSTTDQYIFKRCTPETDEPTGPSIHYEDEKATLADGGPDPSDSAKSRPLPSQGIHTGSTLDPMDKGFIATAYTNVHENLKLTVKEQVILEEPVSSTGTLSSLKHLAKDFSFGDQFFNDKPFESEIKKTTVETEVESMVFVTIQQDSSAIPPMITPEIDLISRPDSPNVHQPLPVTTTAIATTTTTTTILPLLPQPQQSTTDSILMKCISELEQIMANLIHDKSQLDERLDKHGSRLYKLGNLDIPYQVSKVVDEIVTDVVDWVIQALLRDRFRDFPKADMKEILHHRMWESNSYKAHEDHKKVCEAMEKSMDCDQTDQLITDLAEACPSGTSGSSGASGSSQLPPPLPPSTNQSDQSKTTAAPSSSKTAASAEYTAWTTIDTRLKPSVSLIHEDLHMNDDSTPDEQEDRPATPEPAWSIPSSDLPVPMNNWASALASTYAPPPENSLLAQTGDMAMFMDWYCKKLGIIELKQKDLEGPAFEIVKVFHPNVIHLQFQMEECHKLLTDRVDDAIIRYNVSKPLPLGGQPGETEASLGFNSLVYSFRALSTLRRSGLRTASAAAKPCQGDSLEFYLITGRIPTVAAAGQRHFNSQPHAHTSYS
ncbi:retrovirus-related pol polyprotein from transposon TNT 1-94, partial [Tanacetum coccineum]